MASKREQVASRRAELEKAAVDAMDRIWQGGGIIPAGVRGHFDGMQREFNTAEYHGGWADAHGPNLGKDEEARADAALERAEFASGRVVALCAAVAK
jgi:hypothetical protein